MHTAEVLVQTTAQQLLFCTSLIQTATSAGTGFVWSARSGASDVPVLLSNKHVAMKHEPGSFSLAAGDGAGGVKLGERVDFAHADFASLWVGHPNPEVDIAGVLPRAVAEQCRGHRKVTLLQVRR